MADEITANAEQISNLGKYQERLKQLNDLKERFGRLTNAETKELAEVNSKIEILTALLGRNIVETLKADDAFKAVTETFKNFIPAISEMALSLTQTAVKAFQSFSFAALASTNVGKEFFNPINDGKATILSTIPIISGLNSAIKQLRETQEVARTSFTILGDSISVANEKASNYPQSLRLSAAATSITTKELNEMAKTMQIVPNSMEQVSGGIAGISQTVNMTVQPMAILGTVAKAFGMDATQAANMARDAWKNFNQNVPETLKQMGLMADAANKTGVDSRTTQEQIENASKSLAIFGQHSGIAASVWTTFMNSLRSSGVPITEVGKIVDQVTNSMRTMSIEQRAFVGMVSGMTQGSTALGGSLKMELALRTPEGLQQNFQALTSTLSQFAGGRIITLQEAVQNPQLEMQFQLQRQMLGSLANITDKDQQARILETMKSVQSGGMTSVEGGKALNEAFEKGKNIQERTLTIMEKVEQLLRASLGETADRQLEAVDESMRGTRWAGGMEFGGIADLETLAGNMPKVSKEKLGISQNIGEDLLAKSIGYAPKAIQNVERMDTSKIQVDAVDLMKNVFSRISDEGKVPKLEKREAITPSSSQIPTTIIQPLFPQERPRPAVMPTVITPRSPQASLGIARDSMTGILRIESNTRQLSILNNIHADIQKIGSKSQRVEPIPENLLTGETRAPRSKFSRIGEETMIEGTKHIFEITDYSGTKLTKDVVNDMISVAEERINNSNIGTV